MNELWDAISATSKQQIWSKMERSWWKFASEKVFVRDIRLADVLRAIPKRGQEIDCSAHFLYVKYLAKKGSGRVYRGEFSWNLYTDNLNDQSEECISFLKDLLT